MSDNETFLQVVHLFYKRYKKFMKRNYMHIVSVIEGFLLYYWPTTWCDWIKHGIISYKHRLTLYDGGLILSAKNFGFFIQR